MQSNANVILGQYQLQPSGNDKISIDVKKKGMKFVLTVTGSNKPENVTVSFQADMFIFNGAPVGASVSYYSITFYHKLTFFF